METPPIELVTEIVGAQQHRESVVLPGIGLLFGLSFGGEQTVGPGDDAR